MAEALHEATIIQGDGSDENLLLEEIKQNNFDYDKLESFNLRFNNHEDGRASKRVLEILLK